MSFISVIIPFNTSLRYLKDCLDSLSDQKLEGIETIIILNGLSPDDLDEADELIEKYHHLNIVKKLYDESVNVGKARNDGIKLSTGEYLYFLDSDDYVYKDSLRQLSDIAKESNGDFIIGRKVESYFIRERADEETELKNKAYLKKKSSDLQMALDLLVLKHDASIELLSCLDILIKRSIVADNNIEFEEEKKHFSDYTFITKVLKHAKSFRANPELIYIKRQRDDPINSPSLNHIRDEELFTYSLDEFEEVKVILDTFGNDELSQSKREILMDNFYQKLFNFYNKIFRRQFKVHKNYLKGTDIFDRMVEISYHFKTRNIFKKMELKAFQFKDKKRLRKIVAMDLLLGKPKEIMENPTLLYRTIYYNIFNRMDIKDNKITFVSFRGDYYTDSPKYVYQYLYEKYGDKMEYVWILNDKSTKVPGKVKKAKRFSLPYFYHLATSKYWLTNGRQPFRLNKRPEQEIISTWHGTPLKRLGLDIGNVYSGGPRIKNNYVNNAAQWKYLISPNRYTTEIYRSCFAYDKDILEIGYPRNDILYNATEEDVEKIKDGLKIPKGKKVILYAPTWRDDQFYDIGQYKFDLEMDLSKMKEELGDDYVIIIRTHYFIADNLDLAKYDGFAIDVSKYDDIAELYLISDILITDYSSVFFDFANLRRPMLFFTYDLDKYEGVLRGFYLDIRTEVPGPLVFTTEEIIDNIRNIDKVNEEYSEKYDEFYNRFCYIDDGNASRRLVDHVFKEL